MSMIIKAYAKLNLSLAITGMLENGYHTLDMPMQSISLFDSISIEKQDEILLNCNIACKKEKNTAYIAANLFFEHTKIKGGANISIQKNIPHQAGLGGGSSNGAAVLRGLDALYETKLDTATLENIALKIGADAPFFVRGGLMRARGIGEILEPCKNNLNTSYLLIKPQSGVNTAAAYKEYGRLNKEHININSVLEALKNADRLSYFKHAKNALHPAAKLLCPDISQAITDCLDCNADFAMLTGSGSCVFSIYEKKADLQSAFKTLSKKYLFTCIAENTKFGSEIKLY